VLLLFLCACVANPAFAANSTLEVLHSFTNDGENPYGALVLGGDGNFYGTTSQGGASGNGTVFRMTPSGVLTTVLSFDGANGTRPIAGLARGSDGNLYGTTESGGTNNRGTVFQITLAGTLTTFFHFDDINGAFPRAAPVQGSDGNLYGVAGQGGASGNGTVYKLTSAGVATTLFSFDVTRGQNPNGALIQGSDGNFHGTTEGGGANGLGTVFRITPTGTLVTLFSFDGAAHGANPEAALVLGSDGNFYGTTENGGANNAGAVFKMTPAGVVTRLASFGGANGAGPRSTLAVGSDANFYGATSDTIFRITPAGNLTTLYTFTGAQGGSPQSGLVRGTDGNFYGTTRDGGTAGKGTVFRLPPPPSAPSGLSASAGGEQVTLTWSPSAAATGYNIYQGTAAGAEGTTPVQTGITTTSTTITGLESGTYFFTVTTVNANGESSASNEASATVNVPDDFSFTPVTAAAINTTQLSNTITISGLLADTAVPIAVSGDAGAAYRLNDGPFRTTGATVANGNTVQLQVNASSAVDTTTQAILDIGRVTSAFSVTTAAQDTTPNTFSFDAVSGAAPNSAQTSNAVIVSGINTAAPISVSGDAGATYSVNGGPFTASSGMIANGSSLRVRVNAPSAFGATAQVTVDIGGVAGTFSVTTAQDSMPDPFTFSPIVDAAPGSIQISNSIVVGGIATAASISVSGAPGAAYSINDGTFTANAGTVSGGDTVRVRVDASADFITATAATLNIGGVTATFTVTTATPSAGPQGGSLDAFLLAMLLVLYWLKTSVVPGSSVPLCRARTSRCQERGRGE
jgi:uncharacterized repeat protein (TIGR03803 family)